MRPLDDCALCTSGLTSGQLTNRLLLSPSWVAPQRVGITPLQSEKIPNRQHVQCLNNRNIFALQPDVPAKFLQVNW